MPKNRMLGGLLAMAGIIPLPLPAAEETHANFQAVTEVGTSAWNGTLPVTLQGVLLCDPDEMLDSTPNFIPWSNGAGSGLLGGEWQVTFQAVAPDDRGGTTCWMGQNYANRVPPHDDEFSYSDAAWAAELERLNTDPATGHRFRRGDLVQITARRALFYGGKRNINEAHDVDPAANFEISLVASNYGLPALETITLADVARVDDANVETSEDIFDPTRATGGEHWQGMRVRLNGLSMVTTNGWNPTNLWNARKCSVTDGMGRYFTLRHPRYSLGPPPAGRFDAVGIFTQESGSGLQGTNGYELFVQQVITPDPPPLAIARTTGIAITWPTGGAHCQLEYCTDLKAADWHPVEVDPVIADGCHTLPVEPDLPQGFYRLRKTD